MKIICIAGASGSGKTTVGKALANELNAIFISMDKYDRLSNMTRFEFSNNLEEFSIWNENKEKFSDIELPKLREDIDNLKTLALGETYFLQLQLQHSDINTVVKRSEIIILEFPFGRLLPTFQDIDHVVLIDLPLEIALARRILRTAEKGMESKKESCWKDFKDEAENYMKYYWPMYKTVGLHIKENADIVVSGLQKTEVMCKQIISNIVVNTAS